MRFYDIRKDSYREDIYYPVNVDHFMGYLKKRGYSPSDFCKKANVSRMTLHRIRREREVSLQTGMGIARFFRDSLENVFGESDDFISDLLSGCLEGKYSGIYNVFVE